MASTSASSPFPFRLLNPCLQTTYGWVKPRCGPSALSRGRCRWGGHRSGCWLCAVPPMHGGYGQSSRGARLPSKRRRCNGRVPGIATRRVMRRCLTPSLAPASWCRARRACVEWRTSVARACKQRNGAHVHKLCTRLW